MMFLVHVPFTASSIAGDLGRADYSYYFVMRSYLPVLESLGTVREITDPCQEADACYRQCAARGEYCVLLCFAPPHRVPLDLECPVVPVIAWEYDSLPDTPWAERRGTDWLRVLAILGRTITHSGFTARVVREAIRPDYPVVSVPAPLWDFFAPLAARRAAIRAAGSGRGVDIDGTLMDSRVCDFSAAADTLLAEHPPQLQRLTLDGVVYTAVFCPLDGRKNWEDLLSAFCWAFRDAPDCTLVMKLVHHDREQAIGEVLAELRRLPVVAARIVLVHAYLDDAQYADLLCATDFAVNSSLGEGQCLPLMEYMSAGVPAIAPAHTAMLDYLDAASGYPVRAHQELYHWPEDMGLILRTRRFRPEWEGLRRAYEDSRALRRGDPQGYARMSAAAQQNLQRHCSQAVARDRLGGFFSAHEAAIAAARRDAPPSVMEAPSGDAGAAQDEAAWRRDPRQCGLADMVFSGWCKAATGELFSGFTVGPDDTVLDIGCGDGLAVTFAAQQGARVVFCDLDAEKLASLSRRLDERGLTAHGALRASGERLPVRDGTMTRVIATEVLEHVTDPRAVLAEMVRVGRPGARYLISVPDAAAEHFQQPFADPSYFAPPNHVRIIAPQEFEDLVESSGLAIEERGQYGFFWFVWMSFFWATRDGSAGTAPTMDQIAPPYHPLLESWAETWSRFLELPGAPAMLQAFNERMPKTRVIVARRR